MININLNAMEEWERVRRDTEPHTKDVDRNPGTETPDRPELEHGSDGLRVTQQRRRRRKSQQQAESVQRGEEDEAYEVDIGGDKPELAPPERSRAPAEPHRGGNVDVEA